MHEETHTNQETASALHSQKKRVFIIVLTALVLGGIALWLTSTNRHEPLPVPPSIINNEPETPRADADVQMIKTVSPSDELEAIENDIESTNLDILDTELEAIENELKTL